jgi:hypothetical protein
MHSTIYNNKDTPFCGTSLWDVSQDAAPKKKTYKTARNPQIRAWKSAIFVRYSNISRAP